MNKIATTADPEKDQAEARLAEKPGTALAPWNETRAVPRAAKRYGWLSHLRSYLIIDPLIWAYTVILGTISLLCSVFDRNGRTRAILPLPAGEATCVCFGGAKFDTLYVISGGKLYRRHQKAVGAPAFSPPVKLPPWGAG